MTPAIQAPTEAHARRPAQPDSSPKLGQRLLNRYEVRGVLGRGEMGEVLEVRDQQSGNDYALKRVPSELVCNDVLMQSIRANFALVSRLAHPHIATTRQIETDGDTGQTYLIMDLVRGMNLAQWLEERRAAQMRARSLDPAAACALPVPLPLELVLGIAAQIAAALDYAHSQPVSRALDGGSKTFGILHRDLKPANIMVEEGREYRPGVPYVRLVDFGLAAKIQGTLKSLTHGMRPPHMAGGTPVYMAPEQWEGRILTRGADQWALAVMLYEMTAGHRPFDGPTDGAIMTLVREANPEHPRTFTSRQWAALKRTFNVNRRARHRSCTALVKALAKASRQSALLAELPEPRMPDEFAGIESYVEPAGASRGWRKALVAALCLALLGGTSFIFWQKGKTRRAALAARATPEERQVQPVPAPEPQAPGFAAANVADTEGAPQDAVAPKHETVGAEALSQTLANSLELARNSALREDWQSVSQLLDGPLAALGDLDHPDKTAAKNLLDWANAELRLRVAFAAKLAEGKVLLSGKEYDLARQSFENAATVWPGASWEERNKCAAGVEAALMGKREAAYAAALSGARKALSEQRWTDAESAFNAALERRENDPDAQKGVALARQGASGERYEAAVGEAHGRFDKGDLEGAASACARALAEISDGSAALKLRDTIFAAKTEAHYGAVLRDAAGLLTKVRQREHDADADAFDAKVQAAAGGSAANLGAAAPAPVADSHVPPVAQVAHGVLCVKTCIPSSTQRLTTEELRESGRLVELDGRPSTAPTADAQYQWLQVGGADLGLAPQSLAKPYICLTIRETGVYAFELTVTGKGVTSEPACVKVLVDDDSGAETVVSAK